MNVFPLDLVFPTSGYFKARPDCCPKEGDAPPHGRVHHRQRQEPGQVDREDRAIFQGCRYPFHVETLNVQIELVNFCKKMVFKKPLHHRKYGFDVSAFEACGWEPKAYFDVASNWRKATLEILKFVSLSLAINTESLSITQLCWVYASKLRWRRHHPLLPWVTTPLSSIHSPLLCFKSITTVRHFSVLRF